MANNIEVEAIRIASRHTREWTKTVSEGWRDHVQDLSADNMRWMTIMDGIEKSVNVFITSSNPSEKADALDRITKSIAVAREHLESNNDYLGFLFDRLTKMINVSNTSINKLAETGTMKEVMEENMRYYDLVAVISQDYICKIQEYLRRKQEEKNNG